MPKLSEEEIERVKSILGKAVRKSTKKAYSKNIIHWKTFLQSRGITELELHVIMTKEDQVGLIVL